MANKAKVRVAGAWVAKAARPAQSPNPRSENSASG